MKQKTTVILLFAGLVLASILFGKTIAEAQETTAKTTTATAFKSLDFGGTNLFYTPKEHPGWTQQVTSFRVHSSEEQYFWLNFKTHQLIIQPSNAPVRTINLTKAETDAMRDALLILANTR